MDKLLINWCRFFFHQQYPMIHRELKVHHQDSLGSRVLSPAPWTMCVNSEPGVRTCRWSALVWWRRGKLALKRPTLKNQTHEFTMKTLENWYGQYCAANGCQTVNTCCIGVSSMEVVMSCFCRLVLTFLPSSLYQPVHLQTAFDGWTRPRFFLNLDIRSAWYIEIWNRSNTVEPSEFGGVNHIVVIVTSSLIKYCARFARYMITQLASMLHRNDIYPVGVVFFSNFEQATLFYIISLTNSCPSDTFWLFVV